MQTGTHDPPKYGCTALPFALFLLGLFSFYPITTSGQTLLPLSYRTSLTLSTADSGNLPFWLTANRFGVGDHSGTGAALRFAVSKPHRAAGRVSYSLSADAVGRLSPHRTLFFQQLFGELRLGPFLLRAGRKEETAGMTHPYLSLGSMTVSPNAAPITQISVSWPDYVAIPGTDEFVAVKASLAHGWIDGNRIVNHPYLHEKSFYLRLGGKNWPVHGHAGIMHYAMWGGTHINPSYGRLPSSFHDFWRVFFAQGAKTESGLDPEISNVLGNALGAYDFKLDVDLKNVLIRAYRQFYLEDTVSLRFRNVWDGLWGLTLSFPQQPAGIRTFVYEHVNTKRQGSRDSELAMGLIGTDNYYNHGIYSTGWTHRGRVIGMPLILTAEGYEGVVDNILLGHHFALEGVVNSAFNYTLFLTYSRNYGAHSVLISEPFERIEDARTPARHRYAMMIDISGWVWTDYDLMGFVRFAYDWGKSYDNTGVTIGIVREGIFN